MNEILSVLLAIAFFFGLFLVAKAAFIKRRRTDFCAICAAVSTTWVALLALYYLGIFKDQLIIAILLGETTLGIFYLAREKLDRAFRVFQLPFLLTLITAAYLLFSVPGDVKAVIVFLALLWSAFILVFVVRKNKKMRSVAEKLISCCRE